jgi:hemolysin activation/secretion protein
LSAAEFGYGGYDYGRAFDPSEITGDRGVAASWQVDYYTGMPDWRHVRTTPYAFYDIGKVWNEDDGQGPESGASAGLGVNLYHDAGIAAGAELAFPLTRSVATPYPGNNGANPRLNLHFTYNF